MLTIPSTTIRSLSAAVAFAVATLLTAASSEVAAKPAGPGIGAKTSSNKSSSKPSFSQQQLTRMPFAHRRAAFERGAFGRDAFGPGWWGGGYWLDPALYGDDAGVGTVYPAGWTEAAEPLPTGVNCQKTQQTFTVRAEAGGTREVRVTRC